MQPAPKLMAKTTEEQLVQKVAPAAAIKEVTDQEQTQENKQGKRKWTDEEWKDWQEEQKKLKKEKEQQGKEKEKEKEKEKTQEKEMPKDIREKVKQQKEAQAI